MRRDGVKYAEIQKTARPIFLQTIWTDMIGLKWLMKKAVTDYAF